MALDSPPEEILSGKSFWQKTMLVFCVLFGLAAIANTQTVGDGLWYWYADLLLSGHHLYSDMHLPLQPLFVLETEAFMALLGKGWIASKVPAMLHLAAYAVGLFLVLRNSTWKDRDKAIVLGCCFFVSICSGLYRFDDYHVLADCFTLYSIFSLLLLAKSTSMRRSLSIVVVLGVLSGLAITTRLNDGGALLVGVVIGVLWLTPSNLNRWIAIVTFSAAAAAALIMMVIFTGDSLHEYASACVFGAASGKGGAGHVLKYPLLLPLSAWRYLGSGASILIVIYTVGVGLVWAFWLRPFLSRPEKREWHKPVFGVGFLLLPLVYHLYLAFVSVVFISSEAAVALFLLIGFSGLVLQRAVTAQFSPSRSLGWDRREILLLIPLGQEISMSTSSGGSHLGVYSSMALMILLLTIAPPVSLKSERLRSGLVAVAALLLFSSAAFKVKTPYSWFTYNSAPLFLDRQWYRHPVYGPMIIERQALNFIDPVCKQVGMNDPKTELLSLPYPFANYFCATTPWHGYVQTFFDTSTEKTILNLMHELQTAPPQWILYQRQESTLSMNERAYSKGGPLPHRYLDELIEQKISAGEWKVVYTSDYANTIHWDSHWFLIRTR